MGETSIEWTEMTWNPIVGCSIVSPGCTHCYAMGQAARIERMTPGSHYAGTTKAVNGNTVWTGKVALAPDRNLMAPLRRKRPTTWFVNSMGDLFQEDVPDEWIDRVFAITALAPQHTFQVLTKRSARMRAYMTAPDVARRIYELACDVAVELRLDVVLIADKSHERFAPPGRRVWLGVWPIPNVWLGVSAEDQVRANERIPDLLAAPAAIRFVSAEPLLGAINLRRIRVAPDHHTMVDALDGYAIADAISGSGQERAMLDWVIVGGESGPKARPMHPDWARSIRDQCAAAGVPFFFKQWGAWLRGVRIGESRDGRVAFPDGTEFAVISDGHDIVLATCDDHVGRPRHVWGGYWASGDGEMLKRPGKRRAGRLLDGCEHNAMPEARHA